MKSVIVWAAEYGQANSKAESKGEDMAKKINVGDTVYLMVNDTYSKHTVKDKQKNGNRFYYMLSGHSMWYPRERLALTEKEAESICKSRLESGCQTDG